MSTMHHRIIRHGKQFGADAVDQLIVVAPGKVRPADAALEKHVPRYHEGLCAAGEGHMAG